jgi:Emfourin
VTVRVRLEQSGGFAAIPGLSQPVELDTSELSSDESATLEGLVHRTGILAGAVPSVSVTPGGADLRDYTLTVDDGGAVTTVHLRDPITDDAVAALVEHLQSHRHRPTWEAP